MARAAQRSFRGGEIAPALRAHAGTDLHASAAAKMRNRTVRLLGGSQSRAGFEKVCEIKHGLGEGKLIEFEFDDTDQTYALIFGDQYMWVARDGEVLTETPGASPDSITNANPCVVEIVGHGFSSNDHIVMENVFGMTELSGRQFKITVLSADTFSLQDLDGTNIDSTAYGVYDVVNGGTCERIYEIDTPYTAADLEDLQFTQSGDVIMLFHPSYQQRELARTGHTSWTLTAKSMAPEVTRPSSLPENRAGTQYAYAVTAVDDATGEESFPGFAVAKNITGITQANPAVVTSNAHGLSNGEYVYIAGVLGMTQINSATSGTLYRVTGVAANTFELAGVDSTGYGAYTGGGTAATPYAVVGSASYPYGLAIPLVSGCSRYNIYRQLHSISGNTPESPFGYLGTTTKILGASQAYYPIPDPASAEPDMTDIAPRERDPFVGAGNYPSTGAFIQQRLALAGSTNLPHTIDLSRTGRPFNFTQSVFGSDPDDAIRFGMVGKRNAVRHLVDLGGMLIFTEGEEHAALGTEGGAIVPPGPALKRQSRYGASKLPPIIVGDEALFVQQRGNKVRSMRFTFEQDKYRSPDLSFAAHHLFEGYEVVAWAFQQEPDSTVWAVRSDGKMLSLTYDQDFEIRAWSWHDTDGLFEDVISIPEGRDEDSVYILVQRTINGVTRRFVERMTTRFVTEATQEEFIGLDCAITALDGRNATAGRTVTLSTSGGWTTEDTIRITASSGAFNAEAVGKVVRVRDSDGNAVRITVTAYTSSTIIDGTPDRDIPASLQGVATTDFAVCATDIVGLWHLEGEDVAVFADGNVLANPNNPQYETLTVTNGEITLPEAAALVHVGLPFTTDLELLDIKSGKADSLVSQKKLVHKVVMEVEKTRGLWVGAKEPDSDAEHLLVGLKEPKMRTTEGYDSPVSLKTGTIEIPILGAWRSNGRCFIRTVDPLPSMITMVEPEFQVGGK
jgi:hypothetical protein